MVTKPTYDIEKTSEELKIVKLLEEVSDPEIPVLTIGDLGIIRDVYITDNAHEKNVHVVITPTYSGCPAMDMIAMNIRLALGGHGYNKIDISTVLSPAWTTDWMSEQGKLKLMEYGIAPPHERGADKSVQCPNCGSSDTTMLSQFGSTACKALYQCKDCKEPFDYFKCH